MFTGLGALVEPVRLARRSLFSRGRTPKTPSSSCSCSRTRNKRSPLRCRVCVGAAVDGEEAEVGVEAGVEAGVVDVGEVIVEEAVAPEARVDGKDSSSKHVFVTYFITLK